MLEMRSVVPSCLMRPNGATDTLLYAAVDSGHDMNYTVESTSVKLTDAFQGVKAYRKYEYDYDDS